MPDPAEQPTMSIPAFGAQVFGWSPSKSYASKDVFELIEISPYRYEVAVAATLRRHGLVDDSTPPALDVDALADAVAARLFARLAALFGDGTGPTPAPTATTHDPTGPGHDTGSHIRAV